MLGRRKMRRRVFGARFVGLPSLAGVPASAGKAYASLDNEFKDSELLAATSVQAAPSGDRALSSADLDHGYFLFFDDPAGAAPPEESHGHA